MESDGLFDGLSEDNLCIATHPLQLCDEKAEMALSQETMDNYSFSIVLLIFWGLDQ